MMERKDLWNKGSQHVLHVGKEFSHGVEWKPLASKATIPHCQRKAHIENNWEAATDLGIRS